MILSIFIVLASATLATTLFHFFKIPAIVAFIFAGILIGPSCLSLVESLPQADLLTEASAVLLMFTIGLEFSVKELAYMRRPLLYLGLGQVATTILLYITIFSASADIDFNKALFLSFLYTLSSTAVVLKLLQEGREFETPYGRAATSILIAQDLAVIPMLIAVPFLASVSSSPQSFLSNLFQAFIPFLFLACLIITALYFLGRYGIPFLFDRVAQTKNREIFFFTIFLICAICAGLMHKIGLSVSLGAFVAGMLISSSHYGKQAIAEVLPLRNAFLSLFFVSVGMLLDVSFLFQHLHEVLLLGLGLIFIKAIVIFAVVWFSGSSSLIARSNMLLLFQFGEFSFILAELGVQHELITARDRQYFVAVAIISLIATPFLHAHMSRLVASPQWTKWLPHNLQNRFQQIKSWLLTQVLHSLDLNFATDRVRENHVIIIGYGVGGQSLARILQDFKIPFSVIEMNTDTVKAHSSQIDIHYGDGAQIEVLHKSGVERAKLAVVLTSGGQMLPNCLRTLAEANPELPVLIRTNYIREAQNLPKNPKVQYVIGEIETTIEVILQTLSHYDLHHEDTTSLIAELRQLA